MSGTVVFLSLLGLVSFFVLIVGKATVAFLFGGILEVGAVVWLVIWAVRRVNEVARLQKEIVDHLQSIADQIRSIAEREKEE